jgi:hypothetical protein
VLLASEPSAAFASLSAEVECWWLTVADERLRLEHVGEHTAPNDGTEHDGPEGQSETRELNGWSIRTMMSSSLHTTIG